jgi:hypothetical protein
VGLAAAWPLKTDRLAVPCAAASNFEHRNAGRLRWDHHLGTFHGAIKPLSLFDHASERIEDVSPPHGPFQSFQLLSALIRPSTRPQSEAEAGSHIQYLRMSAKKRQLFKVTINSLHRHLHTTFTRQGHIHGGHRPSCLLCFSTRPAHRL